MSNFELDWMCDYFWRRMFAYVFLPILVCVIGLYEQSTALQRYYLYPYFESSILRHSPAETTSVAMYAKYTKDEKTFDILTEKDVVPAVVTKPDKLPVLLTSEARQQEWDHVAPLNSTSMNSPFLAAWLQANVYHGKSIWSLLWFFCWRYFGGLLLFFFSLFLWRNRSEILRWLIVCWQTYRENQRRTQVQAPLQMLSLSVSPRAVSPADRQEELPQRAIQKTPPERPKTSQRWDSSMWVDRSSLQPSTPSSDLKDEETN